MFLNQNGICWLCDKDMDVARFDVHHLKNDHDLTSEDVVALHKECHTKMHKIALIVTNGKISFEGEALDVLKKRFELEE